MDIWKDLNFTAVGQEVCTNTNSLSFAALWKDALSKEDKCVYEYSQSGYLIDDEEKLLANKHCVGLNDLLVSLGGRITYSNGNRKLFIWRDGIVDFTTNYC